MLLGICQRSFFEFRSSGRVRLDVLGCWLAVYQILQTFSFFSDEFFLVSAFFSFVLEKVLVKDLISILTVSQSEPFVFKIFVFANKLWNFFCHSDYVITTFYKRGIKFPKAWSSWLSHFFLNFHAH